MLAQNHKPKINISHLGDMILWESVGSNWVSPSVFLKYPPNNQLLNVDEKVTAFLLGPCLSTFNVRTIVLKYYHFTWN